MNDFVKQNLLAFHRYGATCHYAGGYAKTALTVAWKLVRSRISRGGPTILISPGGTNTLGVLGFVDAAQELEQQVRQGAAVEPRYIFCAVGSCGTFAGLLAGLTLTGLSTKVVGVRVVDRIVVNTRSVAHYANSALKLLRRSGADIGRARVLPRDVILLHEFFGGRYGRVTRAGMDAVRLAADHGVKLETTYTGKAFAGMSAFLKTIDWQGAPALFWNTYNSVNIDGDVEEVSPSDLPGQFRRFFLEKE